MSAAIRAKLAPAEITDAKGALEAFERMNRYDGTADYALAKSMRGTGGTYTSQTHHDRYEAYSEVADGWRSVLSTYLRRQAGIGP